MLLTGCQCKHTWIEATCFIPQTCTKCGITNGSPLEHKWAEATCTDAKTCSICGVTVGDSLGHSWTNATCTKAKTCKVCRVTEGTALGHKPGPAEERYNFASTSITTTQYCLNCHSSLINETTQMDSFVKNGKFLFTPEQFLSRLSSIAKQTYPDFHYVLEKTSTSADGIAAILYWYTSDDCLGWNPETSSWENMERGCYALAFVDDQMIDIGDMQSTDVSRILISLTTANNDLIYKSNTGILTTNLGFKVDTMLNFDMCQILCRTLDPASKTADDIFPMYVDYATSTLAESNTFMFDDLYYSVSNTAIDKSVIGQNLFIYASKPR